MKIYIAAPWIYGGEAIKLRDLLVKEGFEITSRWLERASNTDPSYDYSKDASFMKTGALEEAVKDVEDVFAANLVVVLNLSKSEGKAFEQGLAFAWDIPIVVIGDRTNVFQALPQVSVFKTYEESLPFLKQLQHRIDTCQETLKLH